MTNKLFVLGLLIAITAIAPTQSLAVTGSLYPSYVLKNQYGETSINSVVGGSGALDCVFTVNSADAAGKGVTNLIGPLCSSVFMHTSQTPATGNPNPASGFIVVNLKSAFYKVSSITLTANNQVLTLPPINVTSGLTLGNMYVISSLGTTLASGWQHLGLPLGITPAIGAAFISAGFSTTSGTGKVETPGTLSGGAEFMDIVGNPDINAGIGQIMLRTFSFEDTDTPASPSNGTVVGLHFVLLPLSSQLH